MKTCFIKLIVPVLACILMIQFNSCQKDKFITTAGAALEFSMDTLTFDTVFTDMGSATRRCKVYNPHDQKIMIKNVYLGGGDLSDYNINIDGSGGTSSSDIEVPAGDSIYLFASVFIDPNNGDAIRLDSIMFETERGGTQKVILYAYGWNAEYIGLVGYQRTFSDTTLILNNNKPYVFSGIIAIENNSCIVIPGGTEIYMFGGPTSRPGDRAKLYIGHESCIRSNVGGNLNNPVEFKTHRLEEDYQLIPFHHDGIHLGKTSKNNIIHGTVIRNAVDGIRIDSLSVNSNPKLELHNSMIYNVDRSAILGIQGQAAVSNTVVANSNQYGFVGIKGGEYDFRHCTFVNYGTDLVRRSEAVLSCRNYIADPITKIPDPAAGNVNFTNCIIYGNQSEETEVSVVQSSMPYSYSFNHCLMKVDTFSHNMDFCILNKDPLFEDFSNYNYNIIDANSPAKDAGKSISSTILFYDIMGKPRNPVNPDVGAFEFD